MAPAADRHQAVNDPCPPDHGDWMTRAIDTLISAWIAEQERERVRQRLDLGYVRDAPAPLDEPERDAAPPEHRAQGS
jgi:hypothetical protein